VQPTDEKNHSHKTKTIDYKHPKFHAKLPITTKTSSTIFALSRIFFLEDGVGQTQACMPAFLITYYAFPDDMSLKSDGGIIY
jgi:hypothetical protein